MRYKDVVLRKVEMSQTKARTLDRMVNKAVPATSATFAAEVQSLRKLLDEVHRYIEMERAPNIQ